MNRVIAKIQIPLRRIKRILLPRVKAPRKYWIKFKVDNKLAYPIEINNKIIFTRWPTPSQIDYRFFNKIYSIGSLNAIYMAETFSNEAWDSLLFLHNLLDELNRNRLKIISTPTWVITSDAKGNIRKEKLESVIYSVSHEFAFSVIESLIPWTHDRIHQLKSKAFIKGGQPIPIWVGSKEEFYEWIDISISLNKWYGNERIVENQLCRIFNIPPKEKFTQDGNNTSLFVPEWRRDISAPIMEFYEWIDISITTGKWNGAAVSISKQLCALFNMPVNGNYHQNRAKLEARPIKKSIAEQYLQQKRDRNK